MSNDDFSKEAHNVGKAPQQQRPPVSTFAQNIDRITKEVEKAFVEQNHDMLDMSIRTMRNLVNTELQLNWKPWTIGGQVRITGGPYTGLEGKLLGMKDSVHGQMAEVAVENDMGFIVETGPMWLMGL